MKISVVTVCFNAAATIAATVESALAQDHPDKEILVVDGASRDGTGAIVERYARHGVRLVSRPDRGMYDALNTALALYRGDVFGALNADDTFHDASALGRIAAAMEHADIVHGDLDFFTQLPRRIPGQVVAKTPGQAAGQAPDRVDARRVVRRWRARPRPEGGFRAGWMPAHPTFYVRRAVADAVGPFDLTLRIAADYDFMLRAVELHGFRLAQAQGVLVDMRVGGASTASLRARLSHNLEALASRRRWLGSPPLDAALLAKPARKLGQLLSRRP